MGETTLDWGGPGEQYRLDRIRRTGEVTAAVEPPAPGRGAPVWNVPPALRTLPWFEIIATGIGIICIVAAVGAYIVSEGVYSTTLVGLLASLPLLLVLVVLAYIDRWEPEPWWTKAIAFVWGGGVAILVASIINSALLLNAALVLGDETEAMRFTAVVIAPLAEETFKAAGVLLIVAVRRTTIHSLLDGIIYAGYSGAGFAFIENMQYFLEANAQGTSVLTVTVVLRGVFSPFVHPMATSFTGLALAWAVVRTNSQPRRVIAILAGWGAAVACHSLWNYFGSLGNALAWLSSYILYEMPLFAIWMFVLLRMASKEALSIREGLVPYVRTGWILPAEVAMVTEKGRRKAALKWARAGGRDATRAMRSFLRALAALGLDQLTQEKIGAHPARVAEDRRLLLESVENRTTFLTLTSLAQSAKGRGGQ